METHWRILCWISILLYDPPVLEIFVVSVEEHMKGERMTSLLVEHVCFHCRRNLYLDYRKDKG